VELVYGRWFWFFKENLTIPQTVSAVIVVMFLMLGISLLRTNRFAVWAWFAERRRANSSAAGWARDRGPSEASGD
jgi:hypothetical protein